MVTGGTQANRLSGLSMIFPVQDLRIFPPEELGLLFGNAEEDWSREGDYVVHLRLQADPC